MNASRTITVSVVASKADVIRALKAQFPTLIDVQALPDTGIEVAMTSGGSEITLKWVKPDAAPASVPFVPRLLGRS